MDGYGGGGSAQDSSKNQELLFGASPAGGAVFDASQYEFFGGDVVEEVELGGLEEEDFAPGGFEEEASQLEKEEGFLLGSLSEIDDLSSSYAKLNTVASGPSIAGASRDYWGSRESSSAAELAQDADFSKWFDPSAFNAEIIQDSKQWTSHPHFSSPNLVEPKLLHRTSSYPEQIPHPQHHQNLCHQYSSEPILIPKPPFTSYPPDGRSQHASPNDQSSQLNIPYRPPISSSNLSPFSNSHPQFNALLRGPQYGGNMSQLPQGLPINNQLQNRLANQSSLFPGNHSGLPNNFPSCQSGLMPPPQHSQQARLQRPFQSPLNHLAGLPPQLLNRQLSPSPPMMNNFDILGLPGLRDRQAMPPLRSRHGVHYHHPHPGRNAAGQIVESVWPRFRSKYMSQDEIENIIRMQLAATHSNNPYVEDYYHQACLARKSSGTKLRHHFCPIYLRDSSSKPSTNNEPHAFLQVDALGRVAFPSIRRPRPLLEVDSPIGAESKLSEKPLEQEPMLAARVIIEDGLFLLLDVDDIDRFLQFNQLHDGGAQLRQKRQALLEGLASSLHLVDPLGKNGDTLNLAPKDDLIFLRIVSLAKGRKLLLRYLQLLSPSELTRVVCMAIFRNLSLFFGNLPTNTEVSMATVNLSETISLCVHSMDLKSLAACLASVVCSSEQPTMCLAGSSLGDGGDGASIVLKSILDRATEILTDLNMAGNCTARNREFWQASFDAFFGQLTKYCFNKYDSVVQSFITPGLLESAAIVAKAISREMPIELLRASLPHTNEQQRKVLLEFAQQSMPVLGFGSQGGGNGS